jgi:hypothetical protein
MATPNLALQQIIKGISAKSNIGRVDISWGSLNEAKKRKGKVREATPAAPAPTEEEPVDPNAPPAPPAPAAPVAPAAPDAASPAEDPMAGLPDIGGDAPAPDADAAPDAPATDASPDVEEPTADDAEPEATEDDVDAEKEKGEKVNAELEKAKAETDQAKKELENNAYVKLNTPTGISYLLRKLVDRAVKTNTLDSLASDFTQKLKISEPEDFKTFSDDMIPYKNIPGIAEFLAKVQSLATSKPAGTED